MLARVAAGARRSTPIMVAAHVAPRGPRTAPLLRRLCTTAATPVPAASVPITGPLTAYSRASRAAPLATAFFTCLVKGSASDAVAQLQVERRDSMDWKRNFSFAFFSGAYLGIGQHLIYNVAFALIFGTGTDMITGMKKVIADSTVHVPLIYLPLY